jgi:hypothetical protein
LYGIGPNAALAVYEAIKSSEAHSKHYFTTLLWLRTYRTKSEMEATLRISRTPFRTHNVVYLNALYTLSQEKVSESYLLNGVLVGLV